MGRGTEAMGLVVSLVRTAHEEEIRYPAAALAYYAFVSFVPLLLLVFAVVGEQLEIELSRSVPRLLTLEVRRLVDRSLRTASGRTGAGVLAVLVLVWSGANVVGDVRAVVARVEGSVGRSIRDQVCDAAAVLGGFGLAILAIVATSTLFGRPTGGPLTGPHGFVVLWTALAAAFLPLYHVPSGRVTSTTGALPGAVLAAFGWTLPHAGVRSTPSTPGGTPSTARSAVSSSCSRASTSPPPSC